MEAGSVGEGSGGKGGESAFYNFSQVYMVPVIKRSDFPIIFAGIGFPN